MPTFTNIHVRTLYYKTINILMKPNVTNRGKWSHPKVIKL